jgi:biotin operon repressor
MIRKQEPVPISSSPRVQRTIRLLTLLQSRGPLLDARRLACELNVSRRTILRDLWALRDAGIDVDVDGECGGYFIAGRRDAGLPLLADIDLALLVLAAKMSPLQLIPQFEHKIRSAMAALLHASPRDVQRLVVRLLKGADFDAPCDAWCRYFAEPLGTLFTAVARRRQVLIELNRPDVGEHVLIPLTAYRLEYHGGWWIRGRTHDGRRCHVRLESVLRVEMLSRKSHRFTGARRPRQAKVGTALETPQPLVR